MKRYTIGSRDWKVVIEDAHGDYPAESVSDFAERHHAYLEDMQVGDTCTADLLMEDGIRCAFVRKVDDGVIVLDRMVFRFEEDGESVEREMSHFIEVG